MNRKAALTSVVAVAAVAAIAFAGWIASLPATPEAGAPAVPAAAELEAALARLKPPKRERPLIAVIGINDATETTDYLMPYGILRRADVADVVALSTEPGPVTLYPALRVEADATVAEFDGRHPEGADYVIVPAMSRDDDPAVLLWLRDQAAKGAVIVGVCAGAKVVGAAGLLAGKKATTHWFYREELFRESPAAIQVADRRIVVDDGVATTTGITASMPMAITLIAAIAGRSKADSVAGELGLAHWDARHDSSAFKLTRPFALTVLGNVLKFWDRDRLGIALEPAVDEVSLALVADAWSRTYRSRAFTFAPDSGARRSRNGLRLLPDRVATTWSADRDLSPIGEGRPVEILDRTLLRISARYGAPTAHVVAMQLEYPKRLGQEGRRTTARSLAVAPLLPQRR